MEKIPFEKVLTAVKNYAENDCEIRFGLQRFDKQSQDHLINCASRIVYHHHNPETYEPGGFTKAFLSNNLRETIERADIMNQQFITQHMIILTNVKL